jgi:hypothetical protein
MTITEMNTKRLKITVFWRSVGGAVLFSTVKPVPVADLLPAPGFLTMSKGLLAMVAAIEVSFAVKPVIRGRRSKALGALCDTALLTIVNETTMTKTILVRLILRIILLKWKAKIGYHLLFINSLADIYVFL